MRKLPSGQVWLEEGEVVLGICLGCKGVYQPPINAKRSMCPKCKYVNDHSKMPMIERIPAQLND